MRGRPPLAAIANLPPSPPGTPGERGRGEGVFASSREQQALLRELLILEWTYAAQAKAPIAWDEYAGRFPQFKKLIEQLVQECRAEEAADLAARSIRQGEKGTLAGGADPVTHLAPREAFASTATGADTIDHPSKRLKSGPLPAIPGYEILEEIGAGGMGVVYKARHLKLKRLVALKVMLAGAHARPEDLERFRIEAEAVARLQHPNIVQIYEVGEWRPTEGSAAVPYFALEYVEGGTLAKALAGNPQTPKEAAQMVETLARAMHAAHQAGIIHRDLKPGNILLQIADCRWQISD